MPVARPRRPAHRQRTDHRMVTLRPLSPDDAPALTRIYSGESVRYTTGRPLTLDQAHDKIRTALAAVTETPRAQWTWGILAEDEFIGLITLRRRTASVGTLSYILREDTWGNSYATQATRHVVPVAFATARLGRLEAKHHPDNPASGRVLLKAGFTHIGGLYQCAGDGTVTLYEHYSLDGAGPESGVRYPADPCEGYAAPSRRADRAPSDGGYSDA